VKDQINRDASGKGAKPEGVNPEAPLAEPSKPAEPPKP
jgi:hypothetical protein